MILFVSKYAELKSPIQVIANAKSLDTRKKDEIFELIIIILHIQSVSVHLLKEL